MSALGSRIVALGDYRPARVVTNEDISSFVDTTDEWIRARVGVGTRHIAAPHETVIDMGTAAAGKALATSGLEPAEIDLVITATCTMPTALPSAAPTIAHRLDIPSPGAFDLNGACAGFCYALSLANDAIRCGTARHVLIVGSEKLSDWLDWTDRSTCIIFGDGAGAAVVGPSDAAGIGPVVWGSDGGQASAIETNDDRKVVMDGRAVFRWATTGMGDVARQACERAGIAPAELAAIVPHQANLRIVDAIVRQLGATNAVVARDIIDTGNTSSASVPLALTRLAERGEIHSGDAALLVAFGAGLTHAGQVIRFP